MEVNMRIVVTTISQKLSVLVAKKKIRTIYMHNKNVPMGSEYHAYHVSLHDNTN